MFAYCTPVLCVKQPSIVFIRLYMYAIVPNKLFQVKIYESLQYPLAKTRVIFPAEEMVAHIVIFNEKVVYCVNSK